MCIVLTGRWWGTKMEHSNKRHVLAYGASLLRSGPSEVYLLSLKCFDMSPAPTWVVPIKIQKVTTALATYHHPHLPGCKSFYPQSAAAGAAKILGQSVPLFSCKTWSTLMAFETLPGAFVWIGSVGRKRLRDRWMDRVSRLAAIRLTNDLSASFVIIRAIVCM